GQPSARAVGHTAVRGGDDEGRGASPDPRLLQTHGSPSFRGGADRCRPSAPSGGSRWRRVVNWACSGSARVPRLTHGVKRRNESYFTRSGRGSLPNVSPAVDNVYGAQRVRGRVPRTAPGP